MNLQYGAFTNSDPGQLPEWAILLLAGMVAREEAHEGDRTNTASFIEAFLTGVPLEVRYYVAGYRRALQNAVE